MLLPTLTLITGLTVPWLAGYFCLRTVQPSVDQTGNRLIALSAGLLFGYAAVALILMGQDMILGTVNGWLPVLLLASIAVLAASYRVKQTPSGAPHHDNIALTGSARWLVLALAAGILIHFAYSFIELLTQPLFPWDAWTVWAYRAKAWFYDGSLAPMLDGKEWMLSAEPFRYTSIAINYPYLPSLMHLWAALSLGAWHEALINIPVLACSLAIALGLAGSIRRAGGSILLMLGAVYLLFSIPLMGSHMSLGGYADIWMAGFAGVGMTLLLCGLLLNERLTQVLGTILLLAGCMVKVEGIVWIATALGVYILFKLSGKQILLLSIGAASLVAIAAMTGLTSVNLPLIGELGYRDGTILIPMRSGIRIGFQNVAGAYVHNLFVLGTWHLLWSMVLLALGAVAVRSSGPLKRLMLAFFVVFIASQITIFGLTSQGEWASDYTAINRLPLHMLPPVLFLVAVALQDQIPRLAAILHESGARRSLAIGLAGALALTSLGVLAWQANNQGPKQAVKQQINTANLAFVMGSGTQNANGTRVEEYQDGIAILSSGPTEVDADTLYLLRYKLEFDEDIVSLDQAPAFFWRRADQPREVSRMTLDTSGFVDLAQSEDWGGQIVEYGFFFVENRGEPAEINAVTLDGDSLANTLRQIPDQWLSFTGWSQASSNWLPGGAYIQILHLSIVVLLIAVLGAAIAWLLVGRKHLLQLFALCLMAGWLILDARWLLERSWQAQLSLDKLTGLSIEERIADGHSGKYYPYLQRLLQEELGPVPTRILIILDPAEELYFGLRARYQLLPHAAQLRPSIPFGHPLTTLDYVLFLGDYSDGDPQARIGEPAADRWRRLRVDSPKARRWLKLIDDSAEGTLFKLEIDDN